MVLGLAVAVVLSTSVSVEAEQVCIKYHRCVPLDQFKCETITQSSFINRVCYVEAQKIHDHQAQ